MQCRKSFSVDRDRVLKYLKQIEANFAEMPHVFASLKDTVSKECEAFTRIPWSCILHVNGLGDS